MSMSAPLRIYTFTLPRERGNGTRASAPDRLHLSFGLPTASIAEACVAYVLLAMYPISLKKTGTFRYSAKAQVQRPSRIKKILEFTLTSHTQVHGRARKTVPSGSGADI